MSDATTKTSIPRLLTKGDAPTDRPADATSVPAIDWTYWPLRRNPRLALGVVGGLISVFLIVSFATDKTSLGAMAAVAGVLVAWRIYIPMTYRVDGSGLMLRVGRRHRQLAWSAIERIGIRPDGLLVLPAQRHDRSGPWKQIFVPVGSHRQAVLDSIQHWAPHLLEP